MNERKLFDNWKTFAVKHGLEFDHVDKPHFHGIITVLNISLNSETKLIAHIGKTTSGTNKNWTEITLSNQQTELENETFKKPVFSFFKAKNSLKNRMAKFLKSLGASEMKIHESQITLKFDHLLYDEEQLTSTLSIPEKLKQQLTKTIA